MNERIEVESPAESDIYPYQMLGYLKATLEAGEPITPGVWAQAIAISKKEQL